MHPPRILVLGGSLNQPSHSTALARTIADALVSRGADVRVFDLAEHTLPIADPRYYRRVDEHPDPETRRLGALSSEDQATLRRLLRAVERAA